MIAHPTVTVLMPVLNEEKYLPASIESVLNQTFTDFELLIISEHGTSEESLRIIRTYGDDRIRHIHNSARMGLARSRNIGVTNAKGRYVAVSDADDVNLPCRFEKQVEFLDAHSDVGVVGSRYDIIDEEDKVIERPKPALERGLIKWRLLLGDCPLAHSSVMVRRSVYVQLGGYNPDLPYCEDYELWVRALEVTKIANMPETLQQHRRNRMSVSYAHQLGMQQTTLSISQWALSSSLGGDVPRRYFDTIMLHRPLDGRDTFGAASWMLGRCLEYLVKEQMPKSDRRSVRAYTAQKLSPLALMCLRKWPAYSIRIWRLILELDPALFPQVWYDLMARIVKYPLKSLGRSLSRDRQLLSAYPKAKTGSDDRV
ncbi:MAG: glycosyltransferase [Candidatus Bathyarchaeia archaeon]